MTGVWSVLMAGSLAVAGVHETGFGLGVVSVFYLPTGDSEALAGDGGEPRRAHQSHLARGVEQQGDAAVSGSILAWSVVSWPHAIPAVCHTMY